MSLKTYNHLEIDERVDLYLRTVRYMEKRFAKGGYIIMYSKGKPSIFKQLEEMAFQKYLNTKPNESI